MEDVHCFRCSELMGMITDNAPRGMIYCLPCAELEAAEDEEELNDESDYY